VDITECLLVSPVAVVSNFSEFTDIKFSHSYGNQKNAYLSASAIQYRHSSPTCLGHYCDRNQGVCNKNTVNIRGLEL